MRKNLPRLIMPNFLILVSLLSTCAGPRQAPTPTPTIPPTLAASPARTLTPTPTLTLTSTPTRTPPDLPRPLEVSLLNPLDVPHPYLSDPCQVLQDRWSSRNSPPGTVAMAIMFHSITEKAVISPDQISSYNFRLLMEALHAKGFQAITTEQLLAFLQSNAKIPERSVLLVVDDRRTFTYFDTWFRKYWTQWGWPVVNAWISTDLSSPALWQQQVDLFNEGWVDYQAHGYQHMPAIGPDSSAEYVQQELQKPIQAFQEHFNRKPIAVIWPGGGFTPYAVEVARSLGYQLGFTTNPRGPVLYNWIPLSDVDDPQRPTWAPEGPVKDPLMVLPRYWDTDAIVHLDEVIQVGQQAADYAGQNKATELEYYNIVCQSKYGSIP